jgi:hypothetical protein
VQTTIEIVDFSPLFLFSTLQIFLYPLIPLCCNGKDVSIDADSTVLPFTVVSYVPQLYTCIVWWPQSVSAVFYVVLALHIKGYRTIIFPLVLYGCQTWSPTFREKRGLMVYENRVLRIMFGPKR